MTISRRRSLVLLLFMNCVLLGATPRAGAQPLGLPDRDAPGDEMIQAYLQRETAKISARFDDDVKSLADWQAKRPRFVDEYHYMLGLSPRRPSG
jgi:hypothetical protein